MPKKRTYPVLLNEVLHLKITNLKLLGYLSPNQIKIGDLNWNINGRVIGRISIKVSTHRENPHIELKYEYMGEARQYKVKLVSVPSNLGKGEFWYFLCPKTNKRCRVLYLIAGYFWHRNAIRNCMYEIQTQSKSQRESGKGLMSIFNLCELNDKTKERHFRKSYAGKPTKRYLRILEKIQKQYHEIERAMLS